MVQEKYLHLAHPDILAPTERTHPQGYFLAQILFAQKISQIGDLDNSEITLGEAMFKYTALHRRLFRKPESNLPDPEWHDFISQASIGNFDSLKLLSRVWSVYCQNPRSIYSPPEAISDGRHFGAYIVKYVPRKSLIELHFEDQDRNAPSYFSRSELAQRIADVERVTGAVRSAVANDIENHYQFISLTSWMNNLAGVQRSLPSGFVASAEVLVPPKLQYGGDSMWGQFLNRFGGVHQDRYFQFIHSIAPAENWSQLLQSFPVPMIRFKQPVTDFIAQDTLQTPTNIP